MSWLGTFSANAPSTAVDFLSTEGKKRELENPETPEEKRRHDENLQRITTLREKVAADAASIAQMQSTIRRLQITQIEDRRDLERITLLEPSQVTRALLNDVIEPIVEFLSSFAMKWKKPTPRVDENENGKRVRGISVYAVVVYLIPANIVEIMQGRVMLGMNQAGIAEILNYTRDGAGIFHSSALLEYFSERERLVHLPGSYETDNEIRALDRRAGLPPDRQLQNQMRIAGVKISIKGEKRLFTYAYNRSGEVIESSVRQETLVGPRNEKIYPEGDQYDLDAAFEAL